MNGTSSCVVIIVKIRLGLDIGNNCSLLGDKMSSFGKFVCKRLCA